MYTAYETVRKNNMKRYGIDGPEAPSVLNGVRKRSGDKSDDFEFSQVSQLESHAIHFIRERCEELRFNKEYCACDDSLGTSLKKNQIPYNMEKDTDRLCLEVAVHRFLESGVAEDAFDIYYIFLEMFLGEYKKSKIMIERLSEFESNASSLLMSHRDHYSHSVYVFLIGLAIYDSNEIYRNKYNAFYKTDGTEAAHHFLRYWGFSSLFHDIGYPFELPFEEVKSYFNNAGGNVPYISYRNMDKFDLLDEEQRRKAVKMYPGSDYNSMDEILIRRIDECLGQHYNTRVFDTRIPGVKNGQNYSEYLTAAFKYKPSDPAVFGGYMDHAYFSAMILMKNLFGILEESKFNIGYTDALTAVVLHNSIFKHIIQTQKCEGFDKQRDALRCEWHPLAYLLMLCDELQCWDRTSYGQNSRTEVHAMGCDFSFSNNKITAIYKFDKAMEEKANKKKPDGSLAVGGTYKKMINKKGNITKFQYDIEEIVAVNTEDQLQLEVGYEFTEDIKYRKTYLSKSNFMHLYDFAVILSGRKKFTTTWADKDENIREEMEKDFEAKSLEYKLIDIERVKKFAKYLDAINCFYTDRAVANPQMNEFSDDDMEKIGPMEHERWLWVHHIMGWKYDDRYQNFENGSQIRELTRTHKLMLKDKDYTVKNLRSHYYELPEAEKDKDKEPMNKLLLLLSVMDGVKFYRIITDDTDQV